jgi:hypothetical protein
MHCMQNVDGFEATVSDGNLYLRFTDLFGDGEEYGFPVDEAWKLLGMMAAALSGLGGEDGPAERHVIIPLTP